jgi:hypothetical protein
MSQKLTVTDWPMPAGLGATLMKEMVGMFHGGECALVVGTSVNEAVIESIKNTEIVMAAILFFSVFIFLFSPFFCFFWLGRSSFDNAPRIRMSVDRIEENYLS